MFPCGGGFLGHEIQLKDIKIKKTQVQYFKDFILTLKFSELVLNVVSLIKTLGRFKLRSIF